MTADVRTQGTCMKIMIIIGPSLGHVDQNSQQASNVAVQLKYSYLITSTVLLFNISVDILWPNTNDDCYNSSLNKFIKFNKPQIQSFALYGDFFSRRTDRVCKTNDFLFSLDLVGQVYRQIIVLVIKFYPQTFTAGQKWSSYGNETQFLIFPSTFTTWPDTG